MLRTLALIFFFQGCSMLDNMAYNSTARLIKKSSREILNEDDWEIFKDALPGNIKFLEGLLENGGDNTSILEGLVKAYTGLGYGVYETLYLKDLLLDNDESIHRKKAIIAYNRALNYGFRYLNEKGISLKKLQANVNNQKNLKAMLRSNISTNDLDALFFLANAWGSLINLQSDNMKMISSLPIVRAFYERICKEKPDYQNGACDMFYGVYELGRPKMLGGNHKKGKNHFLSGMKKYPKNYLIRVNYLQFYVIPNYKKKTFNAQMKIIGAAYNKYEENKTDFNWKKPYTKKSEIGLFNAIAFKKYLIMKKLRRQIF